MHGTDRDTPTGGADRDSADVPRGGVPQPHDAPEATVPEPPTSDATTDGSTGTDAPAADADGTAEATDAPAADAATQDAPAGADAVDAPVTTGEDGPRGSTPPPAVPPPVTRARPLAPEPAAPLAAWPSWDDVAVTAPPPEPAPPAAGSAEPAAPEPAAEPSATQASDAGQEPTAQAPARPGRADERADEPEAPAAGPRSGSVPTGTASAGTASAAPAPVPGAPGPLPPLDLGSLSALAFTALNAASVGVPAHALPKDAPARPGDADADGPDGAAAAGPEASGPAADTEGSATENEAAAAPDDATDASAQAAGEQGLAGDAAPGAGSATGAPTPVDVERVAAEPVDAEPVAAEPVDAEPAAERADEVEAVPSVPRTDDTAVVPPTPRPDETTVLPAAGTDVATRATPAAPTVPPRRTSALAAPQAPAEPVAPAGPEPDDASPLAVFEPEESDRRWPRALAITGGALALLAAVYVGSSFALADRVPRGATVAGVEIGGLSSAQAEQHLRDELAERTTSPVAVVAQEVQAEVDPVAAGLELDAAATVARLTGVDLAQPARVWRHVVGVGEQRPVTVADESALDTALTQLSGSLVLAPVDGTVVFADGAAHSTDAVDGWELDTAGAAAVLEDGWLTAEQPVELPTSAVPPAVTQEETDRALAELAQPLAAAPVTVQVADRQAVLDVATLTAHAAVVPVDGQLQLQLDGEALSQSVLAQLPDLLTSASDARFEFQGGAPVIVPGTPGTTLDPATLSASVAQAATAGEGRLAAVDLVESDPAETTAALEALGVKEIVSEFSTPLTSEPRRTSNIATGLRNITGTLVRPGEVFSLTEALGPVDAAHGFVQAGAIVNGEHTDAWGGGLSQVSTTAFNAGYFAGYEDVEHKPHSEWFQRYPEGREATIFTGVLDMRWRNNTPYGALVQGFVADGRAHVRIWSTKHFTVETEKSGRSGVVAPTTVYSQSPTCEPQSAGNPGFTVTNTRKVYLNGELVATEPFTWRYKPQNKVICGTAPAPGASPTP